MGTNDGVRFIDVATHRPVGPLIFSPAGIYANAEFSPDGKILGNYSEVLWSGSRLPW